MVSKGETTTMEPSDDPPPKYSIALAEYIVVAGIASFLWSVLYPAVNMARARQHQPPLWPWMAAFFDQYPRPTLIGIPVIVCLTTLLVFVVFRAMLPPRWKRHFPWFKSHRR